ncbi:hypothetical protein MKZ38_009286 [Zalerion maritima]|uniref:Uncharacterized protein n=1 Tax=Zalerion maritima TaxID=339359 RepID=A0AAD5WT15_9PEZI|nr:hypothetical protein MKZ38_009286 [Zalerion maritima]
MDTIPLYALTTLAWSLLQSLPLLIWPSLISTLLSPPSSSPPSPGNAGADLEGYYARSLALSNLAVGLLVFVLSGFLPLGPPGSQNTTTTITTTTTAASPSPYAAAGILISTLHHSLAALHQYFRASSARARSPAGYYLGCAGNSLVACFGLWMLLFDGDAGRVSRRTGADERTSGFPFGNREADRKDEGKRRKWGRGKKD